MAATRATADGPRDAFRKQLRTAAARYHLERLASASRPIAWALAGALWLVLILALFTPLAAYAWQLGVAMLVSAIGCALAVYRVRVDRRRLLVRMDSHGKLPDSVLTAGDWESAIDDPWRERQRIETLRTLEKMDWRKAWPVRWPRWLWLPVASSIILFTAICFVQHKWIVRTRLAHWDEIQANAPLAPEKLKPLEEVFKDWENAQKIAPSPELAEMLKQIKPMRDQMASGQMTEKQVLLKLNEVQAQLQTQRDKLEAGSLESQAQTMADAVKNLDGMSGLAAALQRKDFAAAKEQAADAKKKYESGAAKMPEGEKAQTAARQLGDAAQKTANDAKTSSSLSQMQKGVAAKDSSEMAKGLEGLKNGLGEQAQQQAQSHALGTQMAQIGNFKNGMGNGSGIQMGLPQLSLTKSLEPQKGAGTGVDPNRYGAQTQLDGAHQEMKLTGTAGQGPSETQTESTTTPHMEQTASGVNAAQFSAYKKLSDQATEDENLPVADRQMIKRYFEDIRPQAAP